MQGPQFSASAVAVVTNCTTRKRSTATPLRLALSGTPLSVGEVASAWLRQVAAQPVRAVASEVYVGRPIVDSQRVVAELSADFFVVSAGLGLVSGREPIPNYDLTVSPGQSTINTALATLRATPSDWWLALGQAKNSNLLLNDLVRCRPGSKVFIALPSSYLAMVEGDLKSIPATCAQQLLIFTSTAGFTKVPIHLRDAVMPYDDRLEGLVGHAGTRSDFPQRAMRHFVSVLKGQNLAREVARATVLACMSATQKPVIPVRQRLSDSEISEKLRVAWVQHGGSSTRLLRFLRDTTGVACEQGRFRGLWQSLKIEMTE